MKKLARRAFYVLSLMCLLSACVDLDWITEEDQLKNEYTVNWIKNYGLIDSKHDWSMARPVTATVDPASFGLGGKVEIYSAFPAKGGALVAVTDEPGEITFDLSKAAKSVYVRAYNADGSMYAHQKFAVTDGRVLVSRASRGEEAPEPELYPVPQSRAELVTPSPETYNFILACEDLGGTFDTDFNDVVFGINYVAGDRFFTVTALAAGGVYGARVIYTHSDGSEEPLFEIHEALGATGYQNGAYPMLNTRSYRGPGKTLKVNLKDGENFSMSTVNETSSRERFKIVVMRSASENLNNGVHIYASSLGEAPQIICMDGTWEWPEEVMPIAVAYPDFKDWTTDRNAMSWVANHSDSKVIVRNYTTTPGEPQEPDEPDEPFTFVAGEHANNTITIKGKTRSYDFYLPTNLQPGAPLVLSLHGSGDKERVMTTAVANANNFVVVYPMGIPDMPFPIGFGGSTSGWGADPLSPNYVQYYQDDLDLFKAIIQKMNTDYQIDLSRVYCCGFSNGGMMTYANSNSACDIFAAFAAVGGIPCNEFHLRTVGDRPVPFLHIHGKADGRVEYAWLPVLRDCMTARNGCVQTPTVTTGSGYTKSVYDAGEGGFPYITYEVEGMGHVSGTNNTEHGSSAATIWDFFKDYTLNSTCDATLKWRFNPDELSVSGWNFGTGEHTRGWTVGEGRCLYYGKNHSYETTVPSGGHSPLASNVYRSLQFKPGYYYMQFNTSTARAQDFKIKLQKKNDPSCEKAFNVKISQGSGEAIIPFEITEYGEYYIAIDKVNQDHAISVCEIHSSPSLRSAANCTNISDNNYPGENTEWEAMSLDPADAQNAGPVNSWETYLTPTVQNGIYTYTSTKTFHWDGDVDNLPNGFAVKTVDVDVTDCDYIMLELAEPAGPGWHFDFIKWPGRIGNSTSIIRQLPTIPSGSDQYPEKGDAILTRNSEGRIILNGIRIDEFLENGEEYYSTTTIKIKGLYKHYRQ